MGLISLLSLALKQEGLCHRNKTAFDRMAALMDARLCVVDVWFRFGLGWQLCAGLIFESALCLKIISVS